MIQVNLEKDGIIVVTGGHGFIGSHVARCLHNSGCHVRIVDIQPKSSFPDAICAETVIGNLCDPFVCRQAAQGATRILHFAAVMGGMGTIHAQNDLHIYTRNHTMTMNLLAAAVEAHVKYFFLASTACVYPADLQTADSKDVSLRETDVWTRSAPTPQGLYGLEKLAAELLLGLGAGRMVIQIARFHNVYGPRGAWKNGREKVPAALLRKAIAAKLIGESPATMEIWGTGQQRRSFLWIGDCVDAVIRLIRSDYRDPVNIGSDTPITIKALAAMAVRVVGLKADAVQYEFHPQKPVGVEARNSNNELIRQVLAWSPTTGMEDGMKQTAEWMEEEMEGLLAGKTPEERATPLHNFKESREVDLDSDTTITLAVLVPITSRGSSDPGECLTSLQKFADSLKRTTRSDIISGAFRLSIYLAVDNIDAFLLDGDKAKVLLQECGFSSVTRLICDHPGGHICALWRDLARRAWSDGCDYMTLMGDDVELLDEGWMRDIHAEFVSLAAVEGLPHGIGCVAFTDVTFHGMPTFPIIHRTHMKIFDGEVVPETFVNQDGDPYLFQLYRRWNASRMTHHRIRNIVGGSEEARYVKQHATGWAFETLDDGTSAVEAWLDQNAPHVDRKLTLDVIVPCYRVQLPFLDRILQLKPSETCTTQFVVIVDDPLSTNITELELKYGSRPDVRIRVNARNVGASASRNRGLHESSAEWVQFLDDDVIPRADLLVEGEKIIRSHPKAAGFVGNTLFPSADTVATAAIHLAGVTYFWDIATKLTEDLPWGVTANLIARRNIRDGVEYDPVFPKTGGGEDIDFCLKKRQACVDRVGEGFRAAPKVVAVHPWWSEGRRSYRRFFMWAKGDGALIKMYPEHTYRDWAPNSAELLLLCNLLLVLATAFGCATWRWPYNRIAIEMGFCVLVVNVGHDLFRHLWRDVDRTKAITTSLGRVKWVGAVMESSVIRMASECGRLCGQLERGEYLQLGRRFDWFVGRVGKGPMMEERKNSIQRLALFILLLAILLVF